MSVTGFSSIAVIGAGTMGAGIAAQIANAGLTVKLLDLPARQAGDNSPAEQAVTRLIKSDPPQLMHKSYADNIIPGVIDEQMDSLSDCDLIIEAVIEQLPVKQQLYQRLGQVISADCIVTSNTSTIPISLLVEHMPVDFRQRFAITHYFNPVRYMRLLELVRGTDTSDEVMDRLAHFNDEVLGKGVVRCADTPGFLGNRVGVYALQLGLHEALNAGLDLDVADAYIGRPFGIPKTGIFGLYDLIGIDLMADVAASLRNILPDGDAFFDVGDMPALVEQMITAGALGEKSEVGFYKPDPDNEGMKLVRDPSSPAAQPRWQPVSTALPAAVQASADQASMMAEPLEPILDDDSQAGRFARRFLIKILNYAAHLVPAITSSPQDIDDAMKLGFNWIRGPFELADAIGTTRLVQIAEQEKLALLSALSQRSSPFYKPEMTDGNAGRLLVDVDGMGYQPVSLPQGAMRFSLSRRHTAVLAENHAATVFALEDDIRLVEFHSKANALNDQSMQMVAYAAENHGRGIIIHNDAQHFSAGVDLNHFKALIDAGDWDEIDAFLARFQTAVCQLKYCPVPVIGAASGLAAGGGFEVLMHCDAIIAHTNSVLGLVESGVGVVPSGGGVKETYLRWYAALGDWNKAAWQTWMQIGYGATGSSPRLSSRYQYFLEGRDVQVMNRDRLLPAALAQIEAAAPAYSAPDEPEVMLADEGLIDKMAAFMQDGIDKGDFMPHDKTVALAIGQIMVADRGQAPQADEQMLYDRERRAFLSLARTALSHQRIAHMLDGRGALRN